MWSLWGLIALISANPNVISIINKQTNKLNVKSVLRKVRKIESAFTSHAGTRVSIIIVGIRFSLMFLRRFGFTVQR